MATFLLTPADTELLEVGQHWFEIAWLRDGGESFPMHDVVGSRVGEARALLESSGLVLAENGIEERHDDEAPEGEVLEQNPPAGEQVRDGDEYSLVVSLGPERVPVPDVAGQSVADARRQLEEAGFEVQEQTEFSSSVPEGQVIRTSPTSGTEAPRRSVVTIVVSDGPEPIQEVEVPSVVNQTQATAEAQLTNRDLNPQVTFANHPSVPAGSVISQDVAPGTTVPVGTNVGIVVSQGPGATTTSTTAPPDED